MRINLVRGSLAFAALTLTVGLSGCSGSAGPSAGSWVTHEDAIEDLGTAQKGSVIPALNQIDLLTRQKQGLLLNDPQAATGSLDAQISQFTALVTEIRSADSPQQVHSLVAESGLDLGLGEGIIVGDPGESVPQPN